MVLNRTSSNCDNSDSLMLQCENDYLLGRAHTSFSICVLINQEKGKFIFQIYHTWEFKIENFKNQTLFCLLGIKSIKIQWCRSIPVNNKFCFIPFSLMNVMS